MYSGVLKQYLIYSGTPQCGHPSNIDTCFCPNYGNSVQNYPELRTSYLCPNGVHSKGVPLFVYYSMYLCTLVILIIICYTFILNKHLLNQQWYNLIATQGTVSDVSHNVTWLRPPLLPGEIGMGFGSATQVCRIDSYIDQSEDYDPFKCICNAMGVLFLKDFFFQKFADSGSDRINWGKFWNCSKQKCMLYIPQV